MNSSILRKPTEDQLMLLMVWRAMALEQMPYMASMLLDLRVLNNPGLGTFAVDADHRLYIDFDAVVEKGHRWCAESLLHECGHLFGNHSQLAEEAGVPADGRFDWNIAGDMSINDDLVQAGCSTLADVLPKHIGADEFQTLEHYYDIIRKKRKAAKPKQGQPKPGQGQGGQGNGQPQPGQGQPGQGQGQGAGQPGQGLPKFNGCGSGSGGDPAPGELPRSNDFGGTAPAATNIEKERVRIATAGQIRDYAAKHPGSVPGGMVAMADFILAPPKVPWRSVLRSHVRKAIGMRMGPFDVTYTRRHRRRHNVMISPGSRVFIPGTFTPTPSIAVIRDTSGSVSNAELSDATNEVDGIAKAMGIRGRDLVVFDTDVTVQAKHEYTGAQSLSEVAGRGGTDMGEGIRYACEEMRPRPTAIVVITDGHTGWPVDRPRIPVIACIIGEGNRGTAKNTPDWMPTVLAMD